MERTRFCIGKPFLFVAYTFLVLQMIIQFPSLCHGLHCWKCISESCHLHQNDAPRGVRVACQKGQSCVKAVYQMGQTTFRYRSVIRTCSAGSCVSMTEEEFRNCSSNPRKYNVTGCALRLCCNDKDFCNKAPQKMALDFNIGHFALFWGLVMLI